MECISIYITFPDLKTAQRILRKLIEEKAIACSNTFPIQSAYWWNEAPQEEEEVAALVKSRAGNWSQLVERITDLHPYDVPCIIRYGITPNESYAQWIYEVTQPMD